MEEEEAGSLGLAPNASCDQGSSAFYWLSLVVSCGRLCLPIVLFPIVHKNSLKTTDLANSNHLPSKVSSLARFKGGTP